MLGIRGRADQEHVVRVGLPRLRKRSALQSGHFPVCPDHMAEAPHHRPNARATADNVATPLLLLDARSTADLVQACSIIHREHRICWLSSCSIANTVRLASRRDGTSAAGRWKRPRMPAADSGGHGGRRAAELPIGPTTRPLMPSMVAQNRSLPRISASPSPPCWLAIECERARRVRPCRIARKVSRSPERCSKRRFHRCSRDSGVRTMPASRRKCDRRA